MKVEQFYRITCEGCGAQREIYGKEPPAEFGPHKRIISRWDTPTMADSEAECLKYRDYERQKDEEFEAQRNNTIKLLVAHCANDEIFRNLATIFPNENGHGENCRYFAERMDAIAEGILNWWGVEQLIGDCSIAYHDLLERCIKAAREAIKSTNKA